jgi:hypothetical protein
MDKKLVLGIGIGIVVIVAIFILMRPAPIVSGGGDGNWARVCIQSCGHIAVSENTPAITAAELGGGMYYGSLNEKKPGTPPSWLHALGGTRSANWYDPQKNPSTGSGACDCAGRI